MRNRRMGEDFATAIVSTQLDTYNPRMYVRHALITLNLTCLPKQVKDGIAKFATKTDIQALGSKKIGLKWPLLTKSLKMLVILALSYALVV